MSSSSAHDGKTVESHVGSTVDIDKKKPDAETGAGGTAVFDNSKSDTTFSGQHESGTRPTSGVDAYNLLKEGSQPITLGDFLISKKLGQGGMGAVFKAKQVSLDRDVALKVLARHLADDEKFVSRFQREARVMAKLDHGNIVRCYSVGKETELWFLAMEFVDGCSLQDLIDKNGKFSVGDALYVTLRVADALNYAHELNLVHRDIKPDNVLITKKGVVKLADLGLAKPMNDDLSMTASGVGAGTPHYMAPEQMRSAKDVDGRADIYALGSMLYVMLTGKKPHDGETLVKLLEQKERGRFEPARKLNPNVPDKLDLMIDKMLAKSLTARYQTCAELMRDLDGLRIAHDYLSVLFPEGSPATSTGAGTKTNFAGGKGNTTVPPGSGSTQTPKSSPKKEVDHSASDIWYLAAGSTVDGRKKVRKLTQSQMKELIKSKQIDSMSEASKQPGTGYRALATYREFEMLFRSQIAQKRMERKTEKLQDKFNKIADEVETYERRKKWGRFFNSVGGWIMLLIALAALAGAGYGIYLVLPWLWDYFTKLIGAT